MNKLRRIDLNLMVTLNALLIEKHISRAALRLHKSQPAVSHALANLRRIFDDPLLVRRKGKLELTARASELVRPLAEALEQLEALMEAPRFDPANTQRTFRLSMSDYGARVILPELVRKLRVVAPNIELRINQTSRNGMVAGLIDGETDLAFGVFPKLNDDLKRQHLFTETFCCLADSSTLAGNRQLDMNTWLARPHVLVSMTRDIENEIDRALNQSGACREISVVLPHWSVANTLISGTDLLLTIASRSLEDAALDPSLAIFKPPFEIEPFDFQMVWHQRRENDPAHIWLRQVICQQHCQQHLPDDG